MTLSFPHHFPPLAAHEPVQLLQPSRIGFGVGSSRHVPEMIEAFGCQALLVLISGSARPVAKDLLDQLAGCVDDLTLIEGVPPEPGVTDVEAIRQQVRDKHLDGVIGIGGGSVLDVAKLIAALHDETRPVGEYFGRDMIPPRRVRLVCLPTTAGAGSEVSPNAVIYDEASGSKQAAISPWLVPDAAFVDPLFTVTLPSATTAATGFDAMSHCIEAYGNRQAHPVVDHYALAGVGLIAAHLPNAVRAGDHLDARSAIALGSLYGGLCLGPVNTAAVHALSYPLGSRFRLPHGLANALLLPHVLRFNIPAAPARYAMIALALGVEKRKDDTATAEAGIERIKALSADCDLELSLEAHGVNENDIETLAEEALKVTRLLRNNLRAITLEDARSIYAQALRP